MVSCVGRLEVPTFSNLDGAPPSPSPCSPFPSPSGGWPPTEDDVVRYHRMMSKENQCCLCSFRISDPRRDEGQLCGLLSSMWNHIALRSAILRRRIGLMKPFLQCSWTFDTEAWAFSISTGNFHFVRASVPERLALPASNVAVGSVFNLDFPILYVLHGNKELTLYQMVKAKTILVQKLDFHFFSNSGR